MNTEKREAIENAVRELGGDYTKATDFRDTDSDYLWYVKGYGNGYQALSDDSTYMGNYICTRDEFNHVVADFERLYYWCMEYDGWSDDWDFEEWIDSLSAQKLATENAAKAGFQWRTEYRPEVPKYQYGVEYECNGVKPDLPDDVEVNAFSPNNGVWGDYPEYNQVENWIWNDVSKFRIVDERYKPKEEVQPNWHERGELPPDRIDVEVLVDGRWVGATTIADFGSCKVCAPDGGGFMGFSVNELRPIQLEHVKLIESACKEVRERASDYNINIDCSIAMRMTVEALYDAGMLKESTK